MDYKKVYTENYFSGKDSFFYLLGYGNFQKTYFKNLFRSLKPYLKDIKQGKVLDVGCAYGFMLQKFPSSLEKFGVDISEHAIAEAKKRLPDATLKVAGAEDVLPFPENFFDIVICNDVIEHLENPRVALENILKVLKKDGILYLNTPNFNWLRKKLFAYADKREHHISLMSHKALLNLLTDVGFNIIDHYTYTSVTFFFFTKFRSNLGHEQAFICKKP
ncbi:MAG TPA: class I SAM-dependent methyltransferase [Candidatus Paceibacterota bacterium]|nr:class I SAM-dependent methyltransferase [Candidatus Paceibacterota bacterium]